MQVILEITCHSCRHQDHSGASTPGGAKAVCGHPKAPESFYPGPIEDLSKARKLHTGLEIEKHFPGDSQPFHWKFRVLDLGKAEPPDQCPIRKGFRY